MDLNPSLGLIGRDINYGGVYRTGGGLGSCRLFGPWPTPAGQLGPGPCVRDASQRLRRWLLKGGRGLALCAGALVVTAAVAEGGAVILG